MRRARDWPATATPAPGDLGVVQAFANTAVGKDGGEMLDGPEALRDWLAERGLLAADAAVAQADFDRTVAVRKRLRLLITANNRGRKPGPKLLELLDRDAARAPFCLRFAPDADNLFGAPSDDLAGALGRLFGHLAVARIDGTWPRLKLCANPDCGLAYYDRSRNRAARWCSMRRCGNRIKAREARDRERRWY